MTLLPDWEHGGFASPDCTETRENGPALMLEFNYNDGDLEELFAVHIGPTWQHELLRKKKLLDKVLTNIHRSRSVLLDTTFAKRVWLSTMDIDHPAKITVRIFKILNQMALQHPDTDMKINSSLFTVDKNHMLYF